MILPVKDLEELIADLRWEHFEAVPQGNILAQNKMFCMRVGEHMGRPVQAILCDGQFVRMRSAEYYADKELHKIDPERLAESLYSGGQWRPVVPDPRKTTIGQAGGLSGNPGFGQVYSTSAQARMTAQMEYERLKAQMEAEIHGPVKSPTKTSLNKSKKPWWGTE